MNKTARAGLSAFVFLLSAMSTFLLLSRCGGGDGSGAGDGDFAHSYSGKYDAPAASGLKLLDTTVNFTLSWNEEAGQVEGEYKDDHFATSPATVSGSVDGNGVRTMTITLASAVDGVVAFVVTTDAATGELSDTINIAKLLAQGPGGSTVFEKSGISITAIKVSGPQSPGPQSPSPSGPVPPGAAGEYFAKIKGEHDFFAKDTTGQHNGEKWTHGKKYKITVGEDGKVTIPTDADPVVYTYTDGTDKFEHYDHEEYAIFKPQAPDEMLAQLQFQENELFFTVKGEGGAFWAFQADDPGALPSYWENKGFPYFTGTHSHKITYANGSDYTMGQAVELVFDANGKVTGTFGEFTAVEDYVMQGTSGGVSFATVTYHRPSKDEYPRYTLEVSFNAEKFAKAYLAYKPNKDNNDGSKGWVAEVGK